MKKLFFVIAVLIFGVCEAQHYPAFSQYVLNGLAINPAYAGRNDALDVTLSHRTQWVGYSGAPMTTAFSLSTPLRKKAISIGISALNDRLGATNNQLINAIYSYRIRVGNYKLSFGLQNGVSIKKTNWDQLTRNDQQDILLNGQSLITTSFISGAGIYFYDRSLFAGVSMPYLVNTANKIFLKENPILINAGYLVSLTPDHSLKPSFLVKIIPGSPVQADLNLSYYYKKRFGAGFSYRTGESIVFIGEFGVNDQLKICYSYDCGLNRLKNYNYGSHELLIRYYFGYAINAKNPRAFFL